MARARVPRRGVSRAVRARTSSRSSCSASSTRASCARTSWRCSSAGIACTERSASREPFYDRFTPAIAASRLRAAGRRQTSTARWTSWPSAGRDRGESIRPRPNARGELAIVLHTHMPYVEGFGTWPFGEEWLWEAIATCYLPLLDAARAARRAADAVAHAGAVRPARGAGRRRAASRASCARCGARRTRSTSPAAARPAASELRARAGARRAATTSARSRALEALGGDLLGALRALRELDLVGHARGPAAAGDRRRRARSRSRPGSPRTARASATRVARRLLAAGVRARAVARPAAGGGRRARHLRRPDRRARPRRAGAAARRSRPTTARCSCRSTARRSSSCGATAATRRTPPTATTTPSPSTTTASGATTARTYDHAAALAQARADAADFVARTIARLDAGAARARPPRARRLRARHRAARATGGTRGSRGSAR